MNCLRSRSERCEFNTIFKDKYSSKSQINGATEISSPSRTLAKMKFACDGYGSRKGMSFSWLIMFSRSDTSSSRTYYVYVLYIKHEHSARGGWLRAKRTQTFIQNRKKVTRVKKHEATHLAHVLHVCKRCTPSHLGSHTDIVRLLCTPKVVNHA